MKESPEQVPQSVPQENQYFSVEEANSIQMGLIAKYFEKFKSEYNGDIDKAAQEWIAAYASEFHALIDQEPELVSFMHEDPERCFAIISEKLYTHTIH